MPKFIDADKLKAHYAWWNNEDKKIFDTIVDLQPTVDAVEVVYCKECKHNQMPPTSGNADCEIWYGMTDLHGYCHCGERREDGTNN